MAHIIKCICECCVECYFSNFVFDTHQKNSYEFVTPCEEYELIHTKLLRRCKAREGKARQSSPLRSLRVWNEVDLVPLACEDGTGQDMIMLVGYCVFESVRVR